MSPDLTVYFDGLCVVCSAEIGHYRRRDKAGRVDWVDIAAPGFDAAAHGLDPREVVRVLHARLANGTLVTGVDTFLAIWERVPGFGGVARVAARPWARPVLELGYRTFVRLRPYLPRRKAVECVDGRCAVS
jgi:predicted DCC family thiol-disulfide oxidoreductase YuxK